jgi:two-component system, NarL family, sensor histidine kinase DegS
MNSEVIKHMGLINALQKEIKRIEAFTRLKIDYTITGEPMFMACEKELFIFRMIQEAFNNVLKHAKATIASLSLNYSSSKLNVVIKDDGSGFDKEAVSSKKDNNAGLKNMEARAKLFNGEMALQTCPGKGTEVYITIPI